MRTAPSPALRENAVYALVVHCVSSQTADRLRNYTQEATSAHDTLVDKDALMSVIQPDGPQRQRDTPKLEERLTSLLAAHQDTGLDAPLEEAQDLCLQLVSRTRAGSDVAQPSELILYGDIQHASFLRNESLDTLHEAICCYERVTVSDLVISRRLALGHGSALATLYDHVAGMEHAEKALQLLNLVLVKENLDELATQALCYLASISFKVQWDGVVHSVVADDYISRIDEMLKRPLRVYLRTKLLLTRTMVAAHLAISKSDPKAAEDWHQFGYAAVDACPPNHFLLAEAYHNLASLFDWRHQLVGDVGNLERAVSMADSGLKICSPHSSIHYTLLDDKARALGSQSQATGDLDLLEDAIDLSREALSLCPPKHRRYSEHVTGLMFLLGTHFETTGRTQFLDEIISFADFGLVPQFKWVACNIVEAIRHRARLVSTSTALALLRKAIRILVTRSEHTSNLFNHEKATVYRELGAVYDLQVELGMDVDHDLRLRLAREAVAFSQEYIEGRMENTINLITVLINQASSTTCASLAVEAEVIIHDTLKDDGVLDHLKISLKALQAELDVVRASMYDAPTDLSSAWRQFEVVVTDASARPRDRLRVAIRWATLAESLDVKSALLAYRYAVDVLPQVGYIGEDLIGRVQALRQARDLVPRAASLALGIGEVKHAIELLEHSRGVLWQQSLHLRPPLHLLPPHLASQLADVSKTLDSSDTDASRRRQAAERFQSIVLEIRSELGHESFLLPCTYDQLVEQLPDGFVVWLIPSKPHCDVIIIDSRTRPHTTHFQHAGLNLDRLQAIATAFAAVHASALRSIDRKARPAYLPKNEDASQNHELLLEELWTSLVQKIILTMNVPSNRGGDRPRIWWCPIGPLTFLPLHAAGIYYGSGQECVSDYVVSSYIPTVTSLINANEASLAETPSNDDEAQTQILLVAQPEVQGLPSLPHAKEEAGVVRSIIPEGSIINLDQNLVGGSIVKSVLALLPETSILHLACHATQCKDDPLQSGFDFADGRLTLRELMRVNHPRAQLAYLSACESAAVDENQPDEAINLAATMLFVGFKSVIATMWSMNDIDGPFVAERIYKRVFLDGVLNLDLVPYALDSAMGELRQRGVDASRWATFVHIGK